MRPIILEKFGADPEVFFIRRNGSPQSAEGLVGGTKRDPLPMEGLPEGFCIQEDNVAAEYNIPATGSIAEWARNVVTGFHYVREIAKKHNLRTKLCAELDFPVAQVSTPHALVLGCDPDYNAWTKDINPRPEAPFKMRTAAAHIHFSWHDPDDEQRWQVVRMLDVFLGLPSILVTPKNRRRQLYGKAGACRPKKYGVEYRVLDNYYIGNEKACRDVLNRAVQGVTAINEEPLFVEEVNRHGNAIQEAINTHNPELASDLLKYFGVRD